MATFPRRHPPPKKKVSQPDYHAYRQEVREDFKGYCAYCGVHDSDWPHGERNYEIDHFIPRTVTRIPPTPPFTDMRKDFYNLRWCCHICNGAEGKGDLWPSLEEEELGIGFVDLTTDDWQTHYRISGDGTLEALSKKAEYTIAVIGLNGDDYIAHRRQIIERGGSLFERASG